MLKAKKEKAPTRLSAFYQNNKFVFLSALVSLLIFLLIASIISDIEEEWR